MNVTSEINILDEHRVIDSADDLQSHATDFSWSAQGPPNWVVKPVNLKEVSEFVKFCSNHSIPVVPSSSKIHFYGAAIPEERGVVLDMTNMDRILDVDAENKRVRIEAG